MHNILTVDLEDWYQAFEHIHFADWPKYEVRITKNTQFLLSILEKYKVKATFFILGYEAQRHPDLVRRVFAAGHEIATHGYSHKFVYKMAPEEFRRELRLSIDILESITKQKVLGHRAPAWSITKDSLWALDILLEEGLAYDSSISPCKSYLFGIADAPRFPYLIREKDKQRLYEFPMPTARIFAKNFPFLGGFFTRLFPYPLVRYMIKRWNSNNREVMVWMHPWDFDLGQPKLKLPLALKRHYFNLRSTEVKVGKMLHDFPFVPLREILKTYA
jgi:polysaccharide deacetylase family protein (PEP-CTERM system associated)